MVTDQQVRRLLKLTQTEKTQAIAAAKAGMDRKTARKYLRSRKLPSERASARTWRTRTAKQGTSPSASEISFRSKPDLETSFRVRAGAPGRKHVR